MHLHPPEAIARTIAADRNRHTTTYEHHRALCSTQRPRLGIRPAVVEQSVEQLAEEILALSEMNWNQSQLDGRLPITLRASKKVAGILKHLPDRVPTSGRYAMYM